MRNLGRAWACCAIGILCALFLFSLLTGAILERFAGAQWIGKLTLLLLWAAAGMCLVALVLSYHYLRQAHRSIQEEVKLDGGALAMPGSENAGNTV
jgi:membrane protein implicated in regulation of membrane protease activity